jgi:hypothetical protein
MQPVNPTSTLHARSVVYIGRAQCSSLYCIPPTSMPPACQMAPNRASAPLTTSHAPLCLNERYTRAIAPHPCQCANRAPPLTHGSRTLATNRRIVTASATRHSAAPPQWHCASSPTRDFDAILALVSCHLATPFQASSPAVRSRRPE